jgi:outer membrane beta-barrel protein
MQRKPPPLASYINAEFLDITRPDKEFVALRPDAPKDIVAVTRWRKDLVGNIVAGMTEAHEVFRRRTFEERLSFVRLMMAELQAHAEDLKGLMMREAGRSRNAVNEEWALCESMFSLLPQFCEEALKEKVSPGGWTWHYAPVGRVFVSSNVALPIYTLLSGALPALIAGNAVCIRPSIHCPLSAYFLAQIIHRMGCPAGLIQIVFGDLDVYRQIIATHAFETVHYCGGEESLEQIRRDLVKDGQARMVLCSGGKNAAVVCADADLAEASRQILHGMTVDCGQRLEATSLVFVEESVLDPFIQTFVQAVKDVPTGVRKGLDVGDEHVMGPLCSDKAWERFLRFQSIAARECNETLRWGKSIDNPAGGYYVSPGVHLLTQDRLTSSVYASNAFFGPDVAIVPVSSYHEAIGGIDKMSAARSLAVFASDKRIAWEVRHESDVPTVLWNCPTTVLDPHLPTFGRGRAGNAYVTGLRFLFATVYPKTLSLTQSIGAKGLLYAMLLVLALASPGWLTSTAFANYDRAVEGNEVVKGKLYPKQGKFQLSAGLGGILNQSYLTTTLIPVGVTYHINEWHAVNVEFAFGISQEQDARQCVENFFYDPNRARSKAGDASMRPCEPNPPATSREPADDPNGENKPGYTRKPAYVPIRQIDQMYNLNYQWTPVYGKALWFLSAVGYLDFYTSAGLGLASSTVWPLKEKTTSGALTRDEGVPNDNTDEWGQVARPEPISDMAPTMSLGIGTRFFFARMFTANLDFRNTSLFGDDGRGGSDFMNFFTIWGGLGVLL